LAKKNELGACHAGPQFVLKRAASYQALRAGLSCRLDPASKAAEFWIPAKKMPE
jgi:hypothetical protein